MDAVFYNLLNYFASNFVGNFASNFVGNLAGNFASNFVDNFGGNTYLQLYLNMDYNTFGIYYVS